jgi:hypothetical protein
MSTNALIIFNSATIIFNNVWVVRSVSYCELTDTFSFSFHNDDDNIIKVSRENIGFADWDEDESCQPFYIFIDTKSVHHFVRMYREDTLNIMHNIKQVL